MSSSSLKNNQIYFDPQNPKQTLDEYKDVNLVIKHIDIESFCKIYFGSSVKEISSDADNLKLNTEILGFKEGEFGSISYINSDGYFKQVQQAFSNIKSKYEINIIPEFDIRYCSEFQYYICLEKDAEFEYKLLFTETFLKERFFQYNDAFNTKDTKINKENREKVISAFKDDKILKEALVNCISAGYHNENAKFLIRKYLEINGKEDLSFLLDISEKISDRFLLDYINVVFKEYKPDLEFISSLIARTPRIIDIFVIKNKIRTYIKENKFDITNNDVILDIEEYNIFSNENNLNKLKGLDEPKSILGKIVKKAVDKNKILNENIFSDKDFMVSCINEIDPKAIVFASPLLKRDSDFIEKVIDKIDGFNIDNIGLKCCFNKKILSAIYNKQREGKFSFYESLYAALILIPVVAFIGALIVPCLYVSIAKLTPALKYSIDECKKLTKNIKFENIVTSIKDTCGLAR